MLRVSYGNGIGGMEMEPKSGEAVLKPRQWILVLILALVAGALGGLLAGGVTVNIDDNAVHYENGPLEPLESHERQS